ncbi:hypothetical protein J4471_01335 [Candidatus Woesearchaeota archaeon]|nr:hypothetical protein [Candidatus Woesearchaeota archaeon]
MERIFIITLILILSSGDVLAVTDCNKQNHLLVEFSYEGGLLKYLSHSINIGCPGGNLKQGDFRLVLSDDKKVIYTTYFSDPTKRFVDYSESNLVFGGLQSIENPKFSLLIPAVEKGKIQVYNKDNVQILTANIETQQRISRALQNQGGLFGWVENLLGQVTSLLKAK